MSATDVWRVIRLDRDTADALSEYARQVQLSELEVIRNVLQREFLPGVKEALDQS